MKAPRLAVAVLAAGMFLPGSAHAAATCLDQYYKCLNDSWDTKGWARFAADFECTAGYAGCLRRLL